MYSNVQGVTTRCRSSMRRLRKRKYRYWGILGSLRIMHCGLLRICSRKARPQFENVYLLGGVVRRDSSKDWGMVPAVRGQIVNVHNKDDMVLSKFYRSIELRQMRARKKIKEEHPSIVNIDGRHQQHLSRCLSKVLIRYHRRVFSSLTISLHHDSASNNRSRSPSRAPTSCAK